MRSFLMVAGAGALVSGCGSGSSADPDAVPGTPPEFRVDGTGTIALIESDIVLGGVHVYLFDRAVEQPIPDRVAEAGDCAIYRRARPTCSDGCPTGRCVADDTCAPFPVPASAGDIELTGLRVSLTMTPNGFGYDMPSLPEDLFADDAAIHIAAAGAAIPAFTADLAGVAPLITAVPEVVEIDDGVDEVFTWTPAAGGAQIQIALHFGWHGNPWTDLLICETADDGEYVLPAALIEQLPHFTGGKLPWPSWIGRFRRTWIATAAGPIEIHVASQQGFYLSHP
jgi:hypothetical protein